MSSPGRVDLGTVRGLGDDRVDDVREQRDVGRMLGGALHVDLGGHPLELAPLAAEHIERVARGGGEREQIEDARARIRH